MFSLAGRLCSEGKKFWLSKCDFCHLYLILGGRGTHVDFLQFSIVFGRHYLPSDARAFSLTSLWNVKLFLRLNDGFRLFKFLQSASWIWKIINNFIFVRKCEGFLQCFVTLGPARPVQSRVQFRFSIWQSSPSFPSGRSRRMDCSLNWSYINYGELRCVSVLIAHKAMIFLTETHLNF